MSAPRGPLPQHRFVCLPPPDVDSERRTSALREALHALLALREPPGLERRAAAEGRQTTEQQPASEAQP